MRSFSLLLFLCSAFSGYLVEAQTLQWLGQTFAGNSVYISSLQDSGEPNKTLGSFPLPAGSSIGTDLFRCMPYGSYCQFIYSDSTGSAHLVNVTLDAQLVGQVSLPPADKIVSLHVDHTTDNSYFTALNGVSGGSIMSISNDGTATTVVDLSSYIAQAGVGATIKNGGATHCSNLRTMWVAISNTSSGRILTINLDAGRVTNTTMLNFPGFDALWADCAEFDVKNDVPGGTVFDTVNQVLSYGVVGNDGSFMPQAVSNPIVGGLVPNGLLTFANVFDTNNNYAALLYPADAKPGDNVKGSIAQFDFEGPGMTVSSVSVYLAGASLS